MQPAQPPGDSRTRLLVLGPLGSADGAGTEVLHPS
jgi:hypothetical protein